MTKYKNSVYLQQFIKDLSYDMDKRMVGYIDARYVLKYNDRMLAICETRNAGVLIAIHHKIANLAKLDRTIDVQAEMDRLKQIIKDGVPPDYHPLREYKRLEWHRRVKRWKLQERLDKLIN